MKKSEALKAIKASVLERNPHLVVSDNAETGVMTITNPNGVPAHTVSVNARKGNIDIDAGGDHLTTFYNSNIEAATIHIIGTLSKGADYGSAN